MRPSMEFVYHRQSVLCMALAALGLLASPVGWADFIEGKKKKRG